jgi:hypothetical protein
MYSLYVHERRKAKAATQWAERSAESCDQWRKTAIDARKKLSLLAFQMRNPACRNHEDMGNFWNGNNFEPVGSAEAFMNADSIKPVNQ